MSEFETEHLKDIQSNCFWAGFLIDLPKDKAWQIADEIVEAIKFAVKQANGINTDSGKCAIPVVTASCCPKCGAPEVEAMTPRTKYKCGSSDYDQRPNTFKQTIKCRVYATFNWR